MKYRGVEGGTPTGEPLCRTCRKATRLEGASPSQTLLFCSVVPGSNPLPFEVMNCSDYEDKRHPSKNDLYDSAWILRTGDRKSKGQWGFMSPEERAKQKLDKWDDPKWEG